MTARAHRTNIFGFGRKKEAAPERSRGSAMTFAQASKLAHAAGYKGTQNFGDWLEAKKLDTRSQEVINRLGQAYRDGMDDRDKQDAIKEQVREAKARQKEKREEKKEEGLPLGTMKTDAQLKAAFARGLTLSEALRENPALRRAQAMNPAAFDRCVKAVKAKGGAANAYAVCTAQGKRRSNPKRYALISPEGQVLRESTSANELKRYKSVFKVKGKIERVSYYKGNPADASAEVFKEFHGYAPTEIISVKKKVHHHEWLAVAGEFAGIQVNPKIGGDPRRIGIGGEAYLSFNEDKNQLFLTGGDQFLSTAELKKFVGPDYDHEILTLGKLTKVGYATNKTHLHPEDGGEAVYSHIFRTTNKAGRHVTVKIAKYPDLIYRVRDQQFEISGGSYKIKAEGIDQ